MSLNVLLLVLPLREKMSFYPPFGALSMIAVAKGEGHNASLLDLDADRCDYEETIKRILKYSPDVIGLSAIVSTSYKYVKEISKRIKEKLPKSVIVVGGGLNAASQTVLKNTKVDLVVHGEGELTFKELLNKINRKESLAGVNGISWKRENQVIINPARELIKSLDTLPFPDYDLIDLDKYILDIREFLVRTETDSKKIDKRVTDPNRSPKFLRINISRGCVNRCTFCFRNMRGIRIHSIKYIGDLIEHVVKKYNIGHISFGDECFGPTKKWLWDFINMIKERNFDLTYHIVGMRVGVIDLEIMRALKELGVWHIQFGFESGSQKILNVMEKNTTVEQNIEAARLAKEVGINTIPFIIINYPGDTTKTIYETIDFLKRADLTSESFRPTFPLAMPGTPLYEFARLKGFIADENKYLESISDINAESLFESEQFINYTSEPDSVVRSWMRLVRNEVTEHYKKKRPIHEKLFEIVQKIKKLGFLGLVSKIISKIKRKKIVSNVIASKREEHDESLRKINRKLKEKLEVA